MLSLRPAALLLLLLAAAAVYYPVGGHEFLDYDDVHYILENPPVRGGLTAEGVRWAFTSFHASNWHPVTWLSHMADVSLLGLDAGRHHLVNLLLHLLNTSLLLLALRAMTGRFWRSLLAAALFALHPLHVESVAWVAERKDLLSALFALLTLLAWVGWLRRPGPGRLLAALLLYALALMSKPMPVTLPLVLLLLDVWPLGRWAAGFRGTRPGAVEPRRLLLEKVPLLAMAAASGAMTMAAQAVSGTLPTAADYPLALRLQNALAAWAAYVVKTFWPARLAVFYPFPEGGVPAGEVAAAALLLAAGTAFALAARRRAPYLAVGWLLFMVTLLPVIGLVKVGYQAMADRYTYLPLVGIFMAAVWGAADLLRRRGRAARTAAASLAVLVLALLAVRAREQVGHWRDGVTLFRHALAVTPDNWQSRFHLGHALYDRGEFTAAEAELRRSSELNPDDPQTCNLHGLVLMKLRRVEEARERFLRALDLEPDYPQAWFNLGLVYLTIGDREGARSAYLSLADLDPAWAARLLRFINYGGG